MKNNFAGLKKLILFYLKKDLIKIVIWIFALVTITVGMIAYFPSLYVSDEDKATIAAVMSNPTMIAMVGPLYGEPPFTIGALAAQQMLLFSAILAGVMNIGIALKNTKQQEDNGITEIIDSFAVGKQANIMAVFIELLFINLLTILLIGSGLFFLNIESIDLVGSFLYAAIVQLVGLVFGSFTLLFTLFSNNIRIASFLSYGFFGGMYLLRASTDISNPSFTWLSPLGWASKTAVFVNNEIFPVLLCLLTCFIVMLIVFILNKDRDIGSSLIIMQSKKVRASALLNYSLGFLFRLERFMIVSWLIIIIVIGASYGSVFSELDAFMENDAIASMLSQGTGYNIVEAFVPMTILIIAIFSTIPCLAIIIKLYSEEKNERVEQLYSLPISRNKMLLNHLILAVFILLICIVSGVLSIWIIANYVMVDDVKFNLFIISTMNYFPAIIFMISLGIFLLGWLPKAIKFVWFYLVYGFSIVYFKNLLDLPDFIVNTSCFGIVSNISANYFDTSIFLTLIAISIILCFIGFLGYNRRDISK